jgi:pSer/pThr/pTyr-binding forkhead associated (FHA) protein
MSDALKITVRFKGEELLSRTFTKDRILIGRGSDCDLRLNRPDVSRHHACIVRKDACGYVFRDLASSNGTVVGGESISLSFIRDGGSARVAQLDLVFRLVDVPWSPEEEPSASPPDPGEQDTLTFPQA